MPPSNMRPNQGFQNLWSRLQPSVAFVVMIFGALIAFEVFNYTTTDHALADLLGNLTFAGVHWSTILAIAFCGIDFAGIARLFTPEQGMDEPKEVWYLFGAWLLAATMNAILTWWGVSMAVANHSSQSSAVVDQQTITLVVPIFVAIMVWVIRILIIGTLSLAMDRLLHPGVEQRPAIQQALSASRAARTTAQPVQPMHIPAGINSSSAAPRPSVMPRSASANTRYSRPAQPMDDGEEFIPETPIRSVRPEPTYHSISRNVSARPPVNGESKPGDNGNTNRFQRS